MKRKENATQGRHRRKIRRCAASDRYIPQDATSWTTSDQQERPWELREGTETYPIQKEPLRRQYKVQTKTTFSRTR